MALPDCHKKGCTYPGLSECDFCGYPFCAMDLKFCHE